MIRVLKMSKQSLNFQILKGLLFAISFITVVFGILVFLVEKGRFNQTLSFVEVYLDSSAKHRSMEIANQIFFQNSEGLALELERLCELYGIIEAEVYDQEGVLYSSVSGGYGLPLKVEDIAGQEHIVFRMQHNDTAVLGYLRPLSALGKLNGYLVIYYDISYHIRQLIRSALLLISLFVSLILTAVVLMHFMTRKYVVSPLSYLRGVMNRVSEGELGAQAEIRMDNEIAVITRVFNRMSSENAAMFQELENVNQSLEKNVSLRTKELQKSQSLLESVLNSSYDGIMVLRFVLQDGSISDFEWLMVNPVAAQFFRDKGTDFVGKRILESFPSLETSEFIQLLRIAAESGIPFHKELYLELEMIRGWYYFSIVPIEEGIAVTFRNITEHKTMELDLEIRARQDGLTGLANRRYFDERMHTEWDAVIQEKQTISLIFIDVDYFKKYNDTYGHMAGDECLKSVSNLLKKEAHRPRDLAVRYGGEEFVILLPRTGHSGAIQMAESLQKELLRLAIPHKESDITDCVTISMGIVVSHPDEASDVSAFIEQADQALYDAKNSGRNRFCLRDV